MFPLIVYLLFLNTSSVGRGGGGGGGGGICAASAASSEPSNVATAIPVIDIGPLLSPPRSSASSHDDDDDEDSSRKGRDDVVRRMGEACRDVGFFAVTNHGISTVAVDAAWDAAGRFFDSPPESKEAVTDSGDDYPYGYERSERLEAGKRTGGEVPEEAAECEAPLPPPPPVDLKETFSLGPPDGSGSGMPSRRFPPDPADLGPALIKYYEAMEALAAVLLRAFASALNLDEGWFEPLTDRHASALRCVNYPALPPDEGDPDGDGDGDGGQERGAQRVRVRAGAHTDYGALTILRSGGPGLQVARDRAVAPIDETRDDNDDDDDEPQWVDAPDLPDAFIVNIGDLMQRWTNDEWRSTLHRVVAPGGAGRTAERRRSMAFFVNVNNDAVVEPLGTCVGEDRPARYPPVRAGEYLMRKHLASMGVSFSEE